MKQKSTDDSERRHWKSHFFFDSIKVEAAVNRQLQTIITHTLQSKIIPYHPSKHKPPEKNRIICVMFVLPFWWKWQWESKRRKNQQISLLTLDSRCFFVFIKIQSRSGLNFISVIHIFRIDNNKQQQKNLENEENSWFSHPQRENQDIKLRQTDYT